MAVHPTVLRLLELPNPSSPTAWGAAVAALDEGEVPWPATGSAAVPGVYLHSLAMNKTAFRALARRAVALDDPRGAKLARSLNAIAGARGRRRHARDGGRMFVARASERERGVLREYADRTDCLSSSSFLL